jgi:(4S)-4-hydroxy-5-phosphonooxypentane-2,3-dione isomerase
MAMPKLVVIGTVEVTAGRRDELLPLLKAHGDRCVRDEPGTLQFQVLVPREDNTKLFVFEVYRDDDAFEAHRNAASIARFREESAGMFVTIRAVRCTPVD